MNPIQKRAEQYIQRTIIDSSKRELEEGLKQMPTLLEFVEKHQKRIDESNGAITWKDVAIDYFTRTKDLMQGINEFVNKL